MAWVRVLKPGNRGGAIYGPLWQATPAVAITTVGLTLNAEFLRTFVGDRTAINLLVDRVGKRLGLKIPTQQDTDSRPYTITREPVKKRGMTRRSGNVTCRAVATAV